MQNEDAKKDVDASVHALHSTVHLLYTVARDNLKDVIGQCSAWEDQTMRYGQSVDSTQKAVRYADDASQYAMRQTRKSTYMDTRGPTPIP